MKALDITSAFIRDNERRTPNAERRTPRPADSLTASPRDPRPGRRRARLFRLLPALALLLGALSSVAPAPAAADVLVGNQGGAGSSTSLIQTGTVSNAQAFTTGDHALGYILESVAVFVETSRVLTADEISRIQVQLWSSTSSGTPDSSIANLTVPSTIGNRGRRMVAFAAPAGTVLAANTTYHLIVFTTGSLIGNGNVVRVARTNLDSETRRTRGWSIDDVSRWSRTVSNAPTRSTSWTANAGALVILVRGTASPLPAVTGLRVTPGDRRLTLRWRAPAPLEEGDTIWVHGYEAAYRCGGGGWTSHGEQLTRSDGRFNDPLSRQTTRVIDGLAPGTAYDVRVRASAFLFRADGGTTHTILSDWVQGTGTPSGAGGPATASACGGAGGQQAGTSGDGSSGDQLAPPGRLNVAAQEGQSSAQGQGSLIDQMQEWRNDPQWVHEKEHTDRWDRALLALGESVSDATLTPMTAAEAQGFADRGWERWVEVAEALRQREASGATDNEPAREDQPPQPAQDPPPALHGDLIGQMNGWRNDPQWVSYKDHTDRWDRALLAFGELVSDTSLTPMRAAEAQGFADQGWTRWVGVAQALNTVVTGTGSADTLTGTPSGELIVGLGGADTLTGHGGNDELRGGDGGDIYTGGSGSDRFVFFSGERGGNILTDFASGDVIVLMGSGWSSVANIVASVEGVGSAGYRYTLASGLTVETTNNRTLRTEDFAIEE